MIVAGVWTGVGFSNLKNSRTGLKKFGTGAESEKGTPAFRCPWSPLSGLSFGGVFPFVRAKFHLKSVLPLLMFSHQIWCFIWEKFLMSDVLATNLWCLMFWQQIWCWLSCCFFPNFLCFSDEYKLDSWFFSFFHQFLILNV